MAGVPNVFGNATTNIPLSQLDQNFNTQLTIGSTSVGLGNTITTLAGLSNVASNVVATTHLLTGSGYDINAASLGSNYLIDSVVATEGKLLMLSWNAGDGFALCYIASSGAITVVGSSNALGTSNAFDTTNNINSNGGVGIALVTNSGNAFLQTKSSGWTGTVAIAMLTVL